MCTHSYCLPSALVIWSTSAALQRIYSAVVPCFSLEFKSLRTDEETHAEREWEKEHNDPLKEAQLDSSIACHSWCCGMWGRVRRKPLIIPPDRTTERLHCTARHHATLHKPHTSTHWPAEEDFRCVSFCALQSAQSLHLWLFALLFFTLSHTNIFHQSHSFSLSCSSSFWIVLFAVSNIQYPARIEGVKTMFSRTDWERKTIVEYSGSEVSLMSHSHRQVAGSLKSACEAGSSVNFSSSLKRILMKCYSTACSKATSLSLYLPLFL